MDTHDPYFVRGKKSYFGNSGEEYIPTEELSNYTDKNGSGKLKSLYKDMVKFND